MAYGAAVQAAILTGIGNEKLQDIVHLDVTLLSLGISVRHTKDMFVLIPRNSSFPAKKERNITTIRDNQTSMIISVYEGERARNWNNIFLGEFLLRGIPPAPRGVANVKFCLDIDANGILSVSAKETTTGSMRKITITKYKSRLSSEMINRRVKDAEMYKAKDINDEKIGAKLDPASKKKIKDAIKQVIQWSGGFLHQLQDSELYEDKLKWLQSVCKPISV